MSTNSERDELTRQLTDAIAEVKRKAMFADHVGDCLPALLALADIAYLVIADGEKALRILATFQASLASSLAYGCSSVTPSRCDAVGGSPWVANGRCELSAGHSGPHKRAHACWQSEFDQCQAVSPLGAPCAGHAAHRGAHANADGKVQWIECCCESCRRHRR